MNKLIIKEKDKDVREYNLNDIPDEITVGSEEDNTIILKDDHISKKQFKIKKFQGAFFIAAFKGVFNTFINKNKLTRRIQLNDGDQIEFCNHMIICRFESVNSIDGEKNNLKMGMHNTRRSDILHEDATQLVEKEENQFNEDKTFIISAENASVEFSEQKQGVETKLLRPSNIYYLLAIYGPYLGKKYKLDKDKIKIGRDQELNDIVIRNTKNGSPDSSISRRHGIIFMKGGRFFFSDKRSKTRSYINRQKLGNEDEVELKEKDEIEIVSPKMSTIFRFVRENDWDFSFPRKSGVWWIRYQWKMRIAFSVFFGSCLLFWMIPSFQKWNILKQLPGLIHCKADLLSEANESGTLAPIAEGSVDMQTSSPAIGDINGDGDVELVFVNSARHFAALNCRSKKILWPQKEDIQVEFYTSIVLADMDRNGIQDILCSTMDSRVFAFDGVFGQELSNWNHEYLGDTLVCGPVVRDLDGNGFKEVVVCDGKGAVYIGQLDASGLKWQTVNCGQEIHSTPCISNLFADKKYRILLGTESGKVISLEPMANTQEVLVDVNVEMNGLPEPISENNAIGCGLTTGSIGPRGYLLVALTRRYQILAYNTTSSERWWIGSFEGKTGSHLGQYGCPVLADINQDNAMDIIVPCYDGIIYAFDGQEQKPQMQEPVWQFHPQRKDNFIANMALADIDKDGIVDAIIGGTSGYLYIVSGSDGKLLGESNNLGSPILSTPVIGDIDGNSRLDIVVQTMHGDIYKITTNSSILKNTVCWGQDGGNESKTNRIVYHKMSSQPALFQFAIGSIFIIAIVFINCQFIFSRKKFAGIS